MHRHDRFDEGHELPAGLPDLPIPRPGEGPSEAAAAPPPIAAPQLGGGASFTAAEPVSEDAPPPPRAHQGSSDRFAWELAATLTAGMLANPARNHASVKDAMAMFDQFLQEMHAYSRIASEFEGYGAAAERRRQEHIDYFQGPPTPASPPPQAKPQPTQPRPMPGFQPLPPGARSLYVPGSMAGSPPPAETGGEAEEDLAA